MNLRQVFLGLAAMLLAGGPAAADDSALNKEGFWTVGRGESTSEACMASLSTESGETFIFQADAGEVTFAVYAGKKMRRGKTALIATEAYSFGFKADYSEDGKTLYADARLHDEALAALKLGNALGVLIDGRKIFDAKIEGTGLENAIEAVVACSKGQGGWWGPGAVVKASKAAVDPPVGVHKDGFWVVGATEDPGICTAAARVDGDLSFVLVASRGSYSFGLGGPKPFKRGRKGRLEMEGYAFDFTPAYEEEYLYSQQNLDAQTLTALRRAKAANILIDGKLVVDMALEGSGHGEIIDDVMACARGEKGWWGDGAKPVA